MRDSYFYCFDFECCSMFSWLTMHTHASNKVMQIAINMYKYIYIFIYVSGHNILFYNDWKSVVRYTLTWIWIKQSSRLNACVQSSFCCVIPLFIASTCYEMKPDIRVVVICKPFKLYTGWTYCFFNIGNRCFLVFIWW
jgi:hypothetical protein